MSAAMSGAYRTNVTGVPAYNGYMTPEGWAFPTPTAPFMPPYLGPRPGRDPTSPFGHFPYGIEFQHMPVPSSFVPSGPYGPATSPFQEPRSTAAEAVAVAQALIDMTKTTHASTVASPSSSSDTLTSNNAAAAFTSEKQPGVDDQRNLIRALTNPDVFQPVPYSYPASDSKPIVFPPGMVVPHGRGTPDSEGIPVDEESYKDSPLPVPAKKRSPSKGSNICQICGKSYARPSTLKTHLRTHSGEKPYRCNICSKAFTQAANLTAHLRTHSGEKPFSCPMCNKRFSQSSSVTTHLRTHSGERPYRCDFCGKCFADTSTLTKHKRIHTGDKPYRCKICNLGFSQSGNLHRHMKTHNN